MNWKITRPNHRIRFEAGEPVAMLVPERRHALEKLEPSLQDLDDDPDLAAEYRAWRAGRDKFIGDLNKGEEGGRESRLAA